MSKPSSCHICALNHDLHCPKVPVPKDRPAPLPQMIRDHKEGGECPINGNKNYHSSFWQEGSNFTYLFLKDYTISNIASEEHYV